MTEPLPLASVRVVSIATNVPGPIAAARLRALGASVVKVEPPSGDYLASAAPTWYDELRAGQRVVTIDLKSITGRAEFDTLLETADVLIVSSRPSALARLGLTAERLADSHPRLCTVSIVGHASPHGDQPGHDLTYQAEAGLLTDALPRSLFSDLAAGSEAVSAVLTMLLARSQSGRGGWREVALSSCAHTLAAPVRHGLTAPGGPLGGGNPAYGVYRSSDGLIAVGALEPHFLQRLLGLLQLERAEGAPIGRALAARPTRDWVSAGRELDIPLVAIIGA